MYRPVGYKNTIFHRIVPGYAQNARNMRTSALDMHGMPPTHGCPSNMYRKPILYMFEAHPCILKALVYPDKPPLFLFLYLWTCPIWAGTMWSAAPNLMLAHRCTCADSWCKAAISSNSMGLAATGLCATETNCSRLKFNLHSGAVCSIYGGVRFADEDLGLPHRCGSVVMANAGDPLQTPPSALVCLVCT